MAPIGRPKGSKNYIREQVPFWDDLASSGSTPYCLACRTRYKRSPVNCLQLIGDDHINVCCPCKRVVLKHLTPALGYRYSSIYFCLWHQLSGWKESFYSIHDLVLYLCDSEITDWTLGYMALSEGSHWPLAAHLSWLGRGRAGSIKDAEFEELYRRSNGDWVTVAWRGSLTTMDIDSDIPLDRARALIAAFVVANQELAALPMTVLDFPETVPYSKMGWWQFPDRDTPIHWLPEGTTALDLCTRIKRDLRSRLIYEIDDSFVSWWNARTTHNERGEECT